MMKPGDLRAMTVDQLDDIARIKTVAALKRAGQSGTAPKVGDKTPTKPKRAARSKPKSE